MIKIPSNFNFFNKLQRTFLKDEEKKFIKLNKFLPQRTSKKIILLEITEDYYFLIHNSLLLKEKMFLNKKIIGIWTKCLKRDEGKLNFIRFLLNYLINLLLKYKWSRLYKSIGVSSVISLNDNFISNILLNNNLITNKKYEINKSEILKLSYKKIKIGDLIYDYYLRYYLKATFDVSNIFVINKMLNYIQRSYQNLEKFYKVNKKNLFCYIPQYASYIQHGLPVRYFLKKRVPVIGGMTSNQYVKKFTINDFLHSYKCQSVKREFHKLNNKNQKRRDARLTLINKFSGNFVKGYEYMKSNPFKKNKSNLKLNFDVVIFLPNFVDEPHCYGNLVFNDFYEWIVETIEYFKNIKEIKLAIKIHPNSLYASEITTNKLRDKYFDLIWLEKNVSNRIIFKNNPRLIISPYGTVLHEAAYHGIIPLAAGVNPYMSYRFVFTPKNKKEYFILLNKGINGQLKLEKDFKKKIEECYYMLFLYNNDYLENTSRKLYLKKNISKPGDVHNASKIMKIFLKENI
jgi:hypothetical protein